jgi:hypothetical protein
MSRLVVGLQTTLKDACGLEFHQASPLRVEPRCFVWSEPRWCNRLVFIPFLYSVLYDFVISWKVDARDSWGILGLSQRGKRVRISSFEILVCFTKLVYRCSGARCLPHWVTTSDSRSILRHRSSNGLGAAGCLGYSHVGSPPNIPCTFSCLGHHWTLSNAHSGGLWQNHPSYMAHICLSLYFRLLKYCRNIIVLQQFVQIYNYITSE